MRKQPNPECYDCRGTGLTYIPTHMNGDQVVDDVERECICTIPDETDDYDADDERGGSQGVRPIKPLPTGEDGGGEAVSTYQETAAVN